MIENKPTTIGNPFKESSDFISRKFGSRQFDVAVVLGSGLSGFTSHIEEIDRLSTADIPGYPRSTVVGHSGHIFSARAAGKNVLVFSGRVHYYESRSTINAAATAIVSHALGIKKIVLTNASGILNESFVPGDLMIIKDQINLTFTNILRDLRFPLNDTGRLYSNELSALCVVAGGKAGVNLQSGVYVGLTGPSYETPAEVRVYRAFGGDAVGMSTVQESIYANAVGMGVLGVSCLTNYSTGITSEKLSHSDVTALGAAVDEKFSRLLLEFIRLI